MITDMLDNFVQCYDFKIRIFGEDDLGINFDSEDVEPKAGGTCENIVKVLMLVV
jgi:hypothetical protein